MGLLPTGSNKLLELRTADITLVIKSKKNQAAIIVPIEERSSSVAVTAFDLKKIVVGSQDIELEYTDQSIFTHQTISIAPLFFEQTDYELIVNSNHGEALSFWNENYLIRDKIGPVTEDNPSLLTGVINFGNSVGYADFEISAGSKKVLVLRIEVFPSKLTYKDDYRNMIADISEMVYGAVVDFIQKTYQEFTISDQHNDIPAIFFQILSMIFEKYAAAVKRITAVPHHTLITEHTVVPEYKSKRTDRSSEKWLLKHQDSLQLTQRNIEVERILTARKQITYDTTENRFVRFILKSTLKRIDDFIIRYKRSVPVTEDAVIAKANSMTSQIRYMLSGTFLKDVSDYDATQSMSLVFGMAPGYRELFKYYIMLQRGLSMNGDVFHMSVKDTAQLYEYWCFIKLFSLLKNQYRLLSPDIIKIDNSGITVTLIKGRKSEARFFNPITGEQITLVYNPGETKTQTVNQRPDNVLELEKKGTEISYKYVFDAKYRIESSPNSAYYPDTNPGPKIDDINTMHRYRDSIVYENKQSRFTFEKTMFGAYILFPYDKEELYKQHRFYKSIETVNIGGLPFLPGSTQLVQKLLNELISDSKESAFERTTLPRGIEEKLAKVDWSRRDILIGTFRSTEQFDICYKNRFYYIPVRQVPENNLPIHYVALYQTKTKFGASAGIRYYGEVLQMATVKRGDIKEVPSKRGNENEPYYRISVCGWKELPKPIMPKESGLTIDFTNLFLLQHSEYVKELQIESEEKFRFYQELKRNANSAVINEDNASIGFEYGDVKFVFDSKMIFAYKGETLLEERPIEDFAKRPAETFRRLQAAVNRSQNET